MRVFGLGALTLALVSLFSDPGLDLSEHGMEAYPKA